MESRKLPGEGLFQCVDLGIARGDAWRFSQAFGVADGQVRSSERKPKRITARRHVRLRTDDLLDLHILSRAIAPGHPELVVVAPGVAHPLEFLRIPDQ